MGSVPSHGTDFGHGAPRAAAEGSLYVLRLEDGTSWSLVELMHHLYSHFPTSDAELLQSVAAALAGPIGGRHRVAVTALGVSWCDTPAADAERCALSVLDKPRPHRTRPTQGRLRLLERLGQRIFGGTLDDAAYDRWSDGRWPSDQPLPVPARGGTPPSVSPVAGLLGCLHRAGGPVGWVWLVPMLHAMACVEDAPLAAALVRARVERVHPVECPDGASVWNDWRRPPVEVCDGLPAGCQIRLYEHPAGSWRAFKPLVGFTTRYQCHWLSGTGVRDAVRAELGGTLRQDFYPGIDPDDHLAWCAVGGAPMGTMTWTREGRALYLSTLCAVTGSRAGVVLVEHLRARARRERRRIVTDAGSDGAGDFYRALGFEPVSGNPRRYAWTA